MIIKKVKEACANDSLNVSGLIEICNSFINSRQVSQNEVGNLMIPKIANILFESEEKVKDYLREYLVFGSAESNFVKFIDEYFYKLVYEASSFRESISYFSELADELELSQKEILHIISNVDNNRSNAVNYFGPKRSHLALLNAIFDKYVDYENLDHEKSLKLLETKTTLVLVNTFLGLAKNYSYEDLKLDIALINGIKFNDSEEINLAKAKLLLNFESVCKDSKMKIDGDDSLSHFFYEPLKKVCDLTNVEILGKIMTEGNYNEKTVIYDQLFLQLKEKDANILEFINGLSDEILARNLVYHIKNKHPEFHDLKDLDGNNIEHYDLALSKDYTEDLLYSKNAQLLNKFGYSPMDMVSDLIERKIVGDSELSEFTSETMKNYMLLSGDVRKDIREISNAENPFLVKCENLGEMVAKESSGVNLASFTEPTILAINAILNNDEGRKNLADALKSKEDGELKALYFRVKEEVKLNKNQYLMMKLITFENEFNVKQLTRAKPGPDYVRTEGEKELIKDLNFFMNASVITCAEKRQFFPKTLKMLKIKNY